MSYQSNSSYSPQLMQALKDLFYQDQLQRMERHFQNHSDVRKKMLKELEKNPDKYELLRKKRLEED